MVVFCYINELYYSFKKLASFIIAGLGALNHFVYEWTGESKFIKWAAATDESTFQHMKLALYPWIITILVSYMYYKFRFLKNSVSSVFGLWVYILMIPVFFYTYTEVLENEHNLTYDIITFILSVIIGVFVWLSTCKFKIDKRLDALLTGFGYFVAIFWFTVCSYNSCPDIYVPNSEEDHDH